MERRSVGVSGVGTVSVSGVCTVSVSGVGSVPLSLCAPVGAGGVAWLLSGCGVCDSLTGGCTGDAVVKLGMSCDDGNAWWGLTDWRSSRSLLMVMDEGGVTTGLNFLKNFLFRVVILPEPSVLTTYWLYCLTSITVPVLSHLIGCGPD